VVEVKSLHDRLMATARLCLRILFGSTWRRCVARVLVAVLVAVLLPSTAGMAKKLSQVAVT
jgi:hypothetical protein